ncbi:glyoxylate carboligase [Escherichia coli]|nr:glyoxylate carboligase [Escherichia coli]EGD4994344.1 glyoxylate carboligase [Escherichia coli]
MARMRAIEAAVEILKKEGISVAFGVPGAAINPLYAAMKKSGGIDHILARHVEGASHMAEGYPRSQNGNIGVCIGTSGPAGTDMITGLYSASADSIPILCITGQAPVGKLHKEDFQAVDIEAIATPVTKMARTILEAGQLPGIFQKAFWEMRSGRPGPVLLDLPFDVQMTEIEFDIDLYQPLIPWQPKATRAQAVRALEMLNDAEKPVIIAGGGIINAEASELLREFVELTGVPVIQTLRGWGALSDDHPLMIGRMGCQAGHRYGNASYLASDFVFGIGNRWANRHTGAIETYTEGRKFIHVDIEPAQIGRIFAPDLGIVSDAESALTLFIQVARDMKSRGELKDRSRWIAECAERKRTMLRRSDFDCNPIKPQRVYHEMNKVFGPETRYISTIGLAQIAANQFLHVYRPRHWINACQAGPLGWTMPAALGAVKADPSVPVVAISGDYDFQFLIEELAVGAQFNLPYIHILLNNAYLGLIRQSQRAFDIDYCVQLSFENINAPEINGYGVDHKAVVEGLGCKAIRVFASQDIAPALQEAQRLRDEFHVPVVVEIITERVTNIAMGPDINKVTEFEEILDL